MKSFLSISIRRFGLALIGLALILALLAFAASTHAAPLDPVQLKLVSQIEEAYHEAKADATGAREEVATEHTAHLEAEKSAADAKDETAKLGKVAATAEAARVAAVKERDAARHRLHLAELAFFALVFAVGFAGGAMESGLRWIVSVLWGVVKIPLVALKAAFPLYLFWLPV